MFGYAFTPVISGWLGYRIMGIDYEDGSGSDKFKCGVTMQGPVIGLGSGSENSPDFSVRPAWWSVPGDDGLSP